MGLLRFSRQLLARPLLHRRPSWKILALFCMCTVAAGTYAIDCIVRPPTSVPLADAGANHAHTMESMAAHAGAPGKSNAGNMAVQMGWNAEAGTPAPDFALPDAASDRTISLADYRGRPVVLVFGSFTCPIFRGRINQMKRLRDEFRDRVEFVFINVTEASHQIPGTEFLVEPYHGDLADWPAERKRRVRLAMELSGFEMTAAVDIHAEAEVAYDGYPLRLVAVGPDGLIAVDLGRSMISIEWPMDKLRPWLEGQPLLAAAGHRHDRAESGAPEFRQ